MGRRSVWSDTKIHALSERFVTAADEVWRLQRDADPECRFFRRMVHGKETPSGGSMQGTYAFAPDGRLLGRINTGSPERTRAMLEQALAKLAGLEEPKRALADPKAVDAGFRWEDSYPEDGLVLMRTARDLADDFDLQADPGPRFNRDAVWFSAKEARGWLPERLEVGARRVVAEAITRRLAQLVLVDNVRGQTIPYHPREIRSAELTAEIIAVHGALVDLRLAGATAAEAKGPWLFGDNGWKPRHEIPHSIRTRLAGSARFDSKRGRFVRFELVGLGIAKGRTTFNARGRKPAHALGFVLQLAPPDWRVAPTFIDVYDADWVKQRG